MSKAYREIRDLMAANLRRKVCVAFSYPAASQDEMRPYIADHLRYMADHEDEILLSGPVVKEGELIGEAITVFQAASEVKAAEFMRRDPLVRRGLRRFDVKIWELREGTLNFIARLSESKFTLE
jgi:uncharacterized protein YciI